MHVCFLPISWSAYLFLILFFSPVIHFICLLSTAISSIFLFTVLILFFPQLYLWSICTIIRSYYFIYIPSVLYCFSFLPTVIHSHSSSSLSFPFFLSPSLPHFLSTSLSQKVYFTETLTYNEKCLCRLQILFRWLMLRDLGLHETGCNLQPVALRCEGCLDPLPLPTTME